MPTRIAVILLSICLLLGCSPAKKPTAVITIDSINITANEFEKAFESSPYAIDTSMASKKAFLDNYILRMLILKEAERAGLNKDPEFLRNVELFWQQSLIKMMLDKKTKLIYSNLKVDDSEINSYYESRKDTEFKNKDLSLVYADIKWMLLNKKQKDAVDAWLNSVKDNSNIKINYKELGIDNK